MNASTNFPIETTNAASTAERFGRRLLLVNGTILTAVAAVSFFSDLAGHFLGLGPFAMFKGNLDSIAFVEAHGLALIVAILLIAHRSWPTARWNWVAAAMHVLLGGSNLVFWQLFVQTGTVPMGIITTVMHLSFVALHVTAALARSRAKARIK